MKRREFLKSGAKAMLVAPLIFDSRFSPFGNSGGSAIVTVFDDRATTLKMAPGWNPNRDGVIADRILDYSVNRTRVSNMVDAAVMKLSGKASVGKAWEALFPAGHPTPETTVSIKLNLSYGEREEFNDWTKTLCPYGPKAAVSDAIVLGLSQMLGGTFPIENILLFDIVYASEKRSRFSLIQGYRPVQLNLIGLQKDQPAGAYGIHWVTPKHPFEIQADAPRFVAAPDFPKGYRAPQRILGPAYQSDFMINIAIAKTHREAGVTGVMKNTYGCTDNPFGTHGTTWREPDTPYPGTRLCAPVFYKSIDEHSPCILNVLDGLSGIYQGGPLSGRVFQENTITVSRNPVAIDTHLLHLINKYRKREQLPLLTTENGRTRDGFPNASFLRIAEEVHGMGSRSMDGSYFYDLSGTKEAYYIPELDKSQSRAGEVDTRRNRSRLHVFMDDSKRTHRIESRIEDIKGKVVKAFKTKTTRSSRTALHWNHRRDDREPATGRLYVWHVTVDGMMHSRVIMDL